MCKMYSVDTHTRYPSMFSTIPLPELPEENLTGRVHLF
jgi:hypothetical protein